MLTSSVNIKFNASKTISLSGDEDREPGKNYVAD
jgi:hypothetical protein